MPFSQKTKELRDKLTPEQREKVERLVARKLATEQLRRMQRAAEEESSRPAGPVERSGADQESDGEPTKGW